MLRGIGLLFWVRVQCFDMDAVQTPLPTPNRCIWCRRTAPDVTFDESHILPECVGNVQQILPAGIVCKPCNNYFGSKVEPALLADPPFHAIAVFLQLVDLADMNVFREKLFDKEHPSVGNVNRDLKLNATIKGQTLGLDVSYAVSGRLEKIYSTKELSFLSRAVHKVALESLAWQIYVGGGLLNPPDLFSDAFDPARVWARDGQPHGSVRPVLRRPNPVISFQWGVQGWKFVDGFGVQLNLFADFYAVNLTSSPQSVLQDLREWVGETAQDMWVVGEKMGQLKMTDG